MGRLSDRARPWFVAVVATLVMSVSYLDRQSLAAIAPTVREALRISHEQFGWLASAFALAYLVFAPIAGRLVDRFGARAALTCAVLFWSLVSAGHALATSFLSLVVLRILLGTAESPSFPGAAQTIRRALPPHRRSLGFGMVFTGSSLGAMVAAPLAVRLARDHGFRFAFVGTALVGLLWVPLWLVATRQLRGADDPAPRAARFPIGALVRHPALVRLAVAIAASAPALALVMNWFPQYLVEAEGVSKDDVGHYLWLPPLLFDCGAVAFGAVASRLDRRGASASHRGLMLVAGLLCATLALVPLLEGAWTVVLLGGISMIGGAGMYVVATADTMSRVPVAAVATAGGISAAVQSIAQIATSPAVGAVVDRTHVWWPVLVALGLLAVPGAVAWTLLPAESKARAS